MFLSFGRDEITTYGTALIGRYDIATYETAVAYLVFCFLLFGHSEPVGFEPSSVGVSIGFYAQEADFCAYPFSLFHLELLSCGFEFLPVETIVEPTFPFCHHHAEVDIEVYSWFVVDDIPLRGLECGNGDYPLGLVLVGSLTDELLEHELVAHPLRH